VGSFLRRFRSPKPGTDGLHLTQLVGQQVDRSFALQREVERLGQQLRHQTEQSSALQREVEQLSHRLASREWMREAIDEIVADSLARPTTEAGHPRLGALARLLREQRHEAGDIKALGSFVARMLHDLRAAKRGGAGAAAPAGPVRAGLRGGLCRQADIETDWLAYWAGRLHSEVIYHRKLWEDCYALQAIWEAGHLQPGRRALGFGVGVEKLPSLLAAHGMQVTATDLAVEDARAEVWAGTNEHAAGPEAMFDLHILDRAAYDRLCEFRPVDMNRIPAALHGGYDVCWSICALEHVGSIEQGLRFIEESVRCLRPGGLAVHTTEYNLREDGPTIDNWPTVLFQRRHIEELGHRLAKAGHRLLDLDFGPGGGLLDGFIDIPPFANQVPPGMPYPKVPHLKLSLDGFPITSIALIVRAGEPAGGPAA
jgi:SAM-dependent methyltransferase